MREAAAAAGLPDDAADVLADAAAGIDGTYRVTYEAEGRTVVVTQRPPERRVDTIHDDGSQDATITADGRTHACTKPPTGEWRCEELGEAPPSGVFDEEALDALVEGLAGAGDDVTIAVESRQVAGTDARCLTSDPPPAALCVAPTGAILLVERPGGAVRAADHTGDVPEDAFELPA